MIDSFYKYFFQYGTGPYSWQEAGSTDGPRAEPPADRGLIFPYSEKCPLTAKISLINII
jgi:hypothetical protein